MKSCFLKALLEPININVIVLHLASALGHWVHCNAADLKSEYDTDIFNHLSGFVAFFMCTCAINKMTAFEVGITCLYVHPYDKHKFT